MLFGLMHAYLLWYGDILFSYAICGMFVYLFRKRGPGFVIGSGIVMLAIGSAISILFHLSMPRWPPEAIQDLHQSWAPTGAVLEREITAYRSGWLGQMAHRARAAFFFQTFLLAIEFFWRAGGLMLVGMGLFKLGVFSARLRTGTYVAMIAAALFVGLPAIFLGVRRNEANQWSLESTFFLGAQPNYWCSILVSLGWTGLIMLLCKHSVVTSLTCRLAAVGQMALTNYIMQTVICTFLFYGHGLGLFVKVERVGQIAIVFAIFAVQLLVSPLWLKRFQFGPLEWLWRSLTYWRLQPFQR
jgi:uncharacterized protein